MVSEADHRWQRLRRLFAMASQLGGAEVSAFLERECGSDLELRRDVEALLERRRDPSDPIDEAVEAAARRMVKDRARFDLEPGQRVGKYRVLHLLREGGMGSVYAATDTELGRKVALKLLTGWRTEQSSSLERFRQEARALAALNHPHIVTIYDLEHEDEFDVLVMELVEGLRLDQLLPENGLSLTELLEIALPLVEAVAAAHERGVIHCDLKPSNIMVPDDGTVRVLDFGLATLREGDEASAASVASSEDDRSAVLMGTIPYMSPEQLDGQELDARTDVFSLGLLLYEMATGSRPFERSSPFARRSPSRPSVERATPELNPSALPTPLAAIVRRCLAEDPDRRFENAGALARELTVLAQSIRRSSVRPPELGEPTSVEKGTRRRRRFGLIAGVAAAAIALAALAGLELRTRSSAAPARLPGVERLAVLPFVDVSSYEPRAYVADGLTEILTETLSSIEGLRVVPHDWMIEIGTSERAVPDVATSLGVDAVVEGSVFTSGDALRVNVRLVRSFPLETVWDESFDGQLGDLFSVQKQMARALVRQVTGEIDRRELALELAERRVSTTAAEAYLRGLDAQRRDKYWDALAQFEKAVAAEPDFARAHLAIATVLEIRMATGYMSARKERDRCAEALERALELEPDLAEAHMIQGFFDLAVDWNWEGAEQAFERAIELSPGLAAAHLGLAELRVISGRIDEGLEILRQARKQRPISPRLDIKVPHTLYLARRFEEAFETIIRQTDTDDPAAHWQLSLLAQARGDPDGAVWFDLAFRKSVDKPRFVLDDLEAAFESGSTLEYWSALARHFVRYPPGEEPAAEFARAYLNGGDDKLALEWLERAFERRDSRVRALAVDPLWDPIRSDPRFVSLVERLALPADGTMRESESVSLVSAGS